MTMLVNLDFFGEDAEFDHIGIATWSIDDALDNVEEIIEPIQKVKVAFANIHNTKFELVEPLNEDSPVTNFLDKGQSIYHVCFKVKNIQQAIEQARKYGFHCIAKPVPAIAFKNKRIAWLFSKSYGLIELLEK